MKKILSFLLSAVACGAMFTATASAANVVVDIDKTEVAIGDVVTVELSVGDISAATFSTGVQFDTTLFECVDLYGAEGKNPEAPEDKEWFYLIDKDARRNPETDADPAPSIDNANSKGVISALWSSSEDVNYAGGVIFTAELKAKDVVKDTDAVISWFEELDCIADDNKDVSLDPVDTETIKIKAPVSKTWKENVSWSDPDDANKTAIWWGFDIAAETFGDHQFVTVTDGADVPKTKTVGIGLADGYEVSGEGKVSFAVAVILDKADVTDKFDAYLGR